MRGREVWAYGSSVRSAWSAGAATAKTGSFGIGKGGLDGRAAAFWLFVGIPLAWGVWITLISAAKIF